MPTAAELERDLEQKRGELAKLFSDHRNEKGEFAFDDDELVEVRRRNEELGPLHDQWKDLAKLEEAAKANEHALKELRTPLRPGFAAHHVAPNDLAREERFRKSLGTQFVESKAYREAVEQKDERRQIQISQDVDIDFKATLATTGLTSFDRPPGTILLGQQVPTVADLIADGTTTAPTIRYMRENTYTNAATNVAEGGAKPEATWDLVEVDAAVRKIAVVSRVTSEMFMDFPQVQSYIDQRMPFMVLQRLDSQIISGDGTAPNLRGLLNTSGIQTQARGTDPGPDAVYKAMNKVRTVGFFEPDAVIFHPTDWTNIRLLRTADGLYIWGSPSDAAPERIWGVPIVKTVAMTVGTALVGAYRIGAQLFRRQGMTIDTTNSDASDFVSNRIAIRCELRAALAVYRPLAFAQCTGL